MQDNLVKEQKDSNIKPNLMVHVNPHTERIAVIRSTIDALYDIRLNLSLKKIIGPFIKRNELKRMIDDAKAEQQAAKEKAAAASRAVTAGMTKTNYTTALGNVGSEMNSKKKTLLGG